MAEENNSSQLKLEQLTEAVKGLYAKSSMSQGEIYNALTSLSQRYENLTNVSSQKIVSTVISEFRKTLDSKYDETGQNLKDLEAHLKNFVVRDNEQLNQSLDSFSKEVSSLYEKLENQQQLLKQTISKVENVQGENISFEINKLSDNFLSFSKGFENITITLNKNFADFLEQIRRFNSKDEINAMKAEILSMTTNVNNAVQSIETIDKKYVSLSNLIETITKKESEFSVAIDEFKILEEIISSIKSDILNVNTKEDFDNFGYEIKEKLENLKLEIKKINLNEKDETQANQIAYLTKEIASTFDDIRSLKANFTDTKGEIAGVKNFLSSFDIELREIKNIINNRLPSVLGDSANEMYFENTKEELKTIVENLNSFKEDIKSINEGNIEILQAPIEKALEGLKNQDLGRSIEGLKINLNSVTNEIQTSIDNLQRTLSNLNNVSSIQLLTQINDSIPAIADRLEIYRSQAVSENNAALGQVKESLNKLSNVIQTNLIASKSNIKDTSDAFDLDILSTLKSDILEYISTLSTTNKTTHSSFDNKLDKLVHSLIGNIASIPEKSFNQSLKDIDYKIEKTNLQQIHNAKELLEEIQNGNNVIKSHLVNIEEGKDLDAIVDLIGKLEEKINSFNKSNDKITDEFGIFKEQVNQKLKENLQKIIAIISNPALNKADNKNTTLETLLIKIQEYISNFEFLKDNVSQEIKENLKTEFLKVQNAIQKIRTSDENSNYNYTLEDVESDLAKMRLIIEKNSTQGEDFKNLYEKVVELRSVGLENVKINRDVEAELGQMSGWFKDTVNRLDDVTEKLDDLQNIGFEDIKTRLLQSEKSRIAVNEFNQKIENALKHLIKNTSSQENKIIDLAKKFEITMEAQKDSFNPSQFIDIFYENMTQTKMLANRVEIIEDKINSIQTAVEKLISYVEN